MNNSEALITNAEKEGNLCSIRAIANDGPVTLKFPMTHAKNIAKRIAPKEEYSDEEALKVLKDKTITIFVN